MKFIHVFAIASLLLIPATYAHHDFENLDLDELVDAYNNNTDRIPGIAKTLFGNERLNVYIDGELFVGVVAKDAKIVEYDRSAVEKPTMNVYATSDVIDALVDGNITLNDALQNKAIDYEGVGFFSKIKVAILKFFQRFFI